MSLRKGVLLRSHRKSISELDLKQSKKDTNNASLNGTFTKEKRDTRQITKSNAEETVTINQSTTTTTNNNKKKKKRTNNQSFEKKKPKRMEQEKENSLPIAQSTLINSVIEDAQSSRKNKTLDISELPGASEEESDISSINTADLNKSEVVVPTSTTQNNQTSKRGEMPENKVSSSSQEKVDLVMEYKLKYERLCGIFKQLKDQHTQLVSVFQKQVAETKESREVQQKTIFQLESDKFRLEDELHKVKEDNERLNERLTQNTDTTTTATTTTANKSKEVDRGDVADDVNTTTTSSRNISLNKSSLLDVSAVMDTLLKSDVRFSRRKRKSLLSNTIGIQAKDQGVDKQEFYEDIILDQQDILDFYSLLCGTSMRKLKPGEDDDGNDDVVDDNAAEEDPVEMEYDCKLQLDQQPLEGYPFTFKLNLKRREARYEPCVDTVQMSRYGAHLPCKLQTGITYRADDAYMFVHELANKLSSSPSTTSSSSSTTKT